MPGKEKREKGFDTPIDGGAWEKVLLARHVNRPKSLDFINGICEEFVELHGDRRFGEDAALVAGMGRFEGRAVMLVGHQKGRDTKDNLLRNWGMPKPEGYRKALRLFEQAEKFGMPVITFIDTPGAHPGKESEERSVGLAIAENLMALCRVRVPIITLVTGEGGSGGALALGIADRLLMLENAIYTVASPEGAAAILWRDAGQAPAAAEAMKVTAEDLFVFGIVDEVLLEPSGGAHSDPTATFATVRESIARQLEQLEQQYLVRGEEGIAEMLEARYQKYRHIGQWQELSPLSQAEAVEAD